MLRFFLSQSPRTPWGWFVGGGSLLLFGLSLWAFAELADDAPEGDYLVHEEKILRAFRQTGDLSQPIGPSWLPDSARDVTALGGATVLSFLVLFVVVFELLSGRRRTAILIVVATVGGLALSIFLKELFGRERPTAVPHLMIESSASFPSGHSMLSSVVYLTLGALLARTTPSRKIKTVIIVTAFFITFAIGLSRVFLGVHYPTDVAAGWTAGTAWALLCWVCAGLIDRWIGSPEKPSNDEVI